MTEQILPMKQPVVWWKSRVAWGLVGVTVVIAAFLRGNYLLGTDGGIIYAVVSVGAVWLLTRTLRQPGVWWWPRAIVMGSLSTVLAVLLTFPALVNSDLQHFIDKQATERAVRGELAEMFRSDPEFRRLSVSTTQFKVVHVRIQGTVSNQSELKQVRSRAEEECRTLAFCSVEWDVDIDDAGDGSSP